MDYPLAMFCLVDGEVPSRAFQVSISSTATVSDLKKLIKAEKTNDFSDVDADKLTLWRVSYPITAANRHTAVLLSSMDSATELEPMDDIADVFQDMPPKRTVHVIVQRPPPARASPSLFGHLSEPFRPESPTDIRADLDKITIEFFNPASQHIKFLDEFVRGSRNLPLTKGSIPGLPAVSGCGKTRTAVDLLSRCWGFYFNAGAADYGSSDLHSLDRALFTNSSFYMSNDVVANTEKVQCLTYGLLYSRLLILEYCLNLAKGTDTFSCQRWMLLQVATPAFEDIFLALFSLIFNYLHIRLQTSTAMNRNVSIMVEQLFREVKDLLRSSSPSSTVHSKFLVVLDESQILGRLSSASFLDSNKTVRPVLAPVLYAFRRLAGDASKDVCVMPCGTGLSSYDLTWAGGSASGDKMSTDEYSAAEFSDTVVDFAGWTDEEAIRSYVKRLGKGLGNEAEKRLEQLIPPEAISRLFRKLRGRFRPIVSTIEDIIVTDDPMAWEQRILEREYRLTTAYIPLTDNERKRLEGNLCGELRRMFALVRQDPDSVAFAEFRNVEATLRLAVATYVTQGGYMAFKGQLPSLVEAAFGRIRLVNDTYCTTIDEPFALLAADNYCLSIDPNYSQHRHDQLERSPTERTRGKEWEFSIPFEMVHLFHKKTVSTRLFHGAEPPHEMFQREATIAGWSGSMRTTGSQEMTMDEFLDAHVNKNSLRDDEPVPPFFYPEEHLSGPDIVFVVRFSGPDSASGDIVCPVFVQLKLCVKLSASEVAQAHSTVQPSKIKRHGVNNLSDYCKHGHFISLIVCYPVEVADYFLDRPLTIHKDGPTEITLTIDDSNIGDLFTERHVKTLENTKRRAAEMAATSKEVKRRKREKSSPRNSQLILSPAQDDKMA
ncbi:hypothetical protein BGZ70_005179 [Mortierella alpina]|uniref:Crinkler effector protein N-terminal domain-containing protein n=1 Tax=Mortierella alpina TaxID=64518 RepID=A0A9P6J9M3_MORAP|nr:hypothetical protein BGZ70_005179 [Mortierella alpina]